MNILLCPDKFKGSLTAMQVCDAITQGIHQFDQDIEVITHPLADGGDGMLDILMENIGLDMVSITVNDPLFRPIQAKYGISRDGNNAYVEMSKASGLVLLAEAERDCMITSTFGTGELILDAINRGARHIVLGLGGSATNDAGIGAAAALGYRFLDAEGNELAAIGKNLDRIATIDDSQLLIDLNEIQVDLASDVQHPFCGPNGAAWGFSRQKGADDAAIKILDAGLEHVADMVQDRSGIDLRQIPGAGAAGGLGGGAIAFLNANMKSGIEMMIEVTGFEEKVAETDLVVTGEGKLDEQTLGGKVIDGVVSVAQKYNKKVAVLCGACTLSTEEVRAAGIFYHDQLLKEPRTLADAMAHGDEYLTQCAVEMMESVADQLA